MYIRSSAARKERHSSREAKRKIVLGINNLSSFIVYEFLLFLHKLSHYVVVSECHVNQGLLVQCWRVKRWRLHFLIGENGLKQSLGLHER